MTARSEALQWIHDLPPRSLFRGEEVPGHVQRRYEMLSRLCAGSDPLLERVARGLYYKRDEPGGLGIEYTTREFLRALCMVAEPGGGLEGLSALNLLGWSLQQPARYLMSTTASAPPKTTPMTFVVWECGAPQHRRDLTWAEVTLIEGTRRWYTSDAVDWDDALVSIANRSCFRRLPDDPVIRVDFLEEATAMEQPCDFEVRLQEMMKGRSTDAPFDVRLREVVLACNAAGF